MTRKNKPENTSVFWAGMWSILGTFLVKGTYFLTIPLYSRLLSTEEYGEINIFMTYASVFTLILSLYLASSVSTGVIKFAAKKDDFLASVISLSLLIFLILGGIIEILHLQIEKLLELNWYTLNCLLLYSFSLHLCTTNSSSLIMNCQYRKNAMLSFFVLLLDTVLSVILITNFANYDNVKGRIIGATVPYTLFGFMIALHFLRKGNQRFNTEYWKFAVTISIPLIFHGLGNLILSQSDRIMIKRFNGASAAGIYALIYNLSAMLNAVQDALNNVWIPWLFRKLKKESFTEIKAVANTYVLIFAVGTISLMSIAPEIIRILAPEEYQEGIPCTIPLIFASFMGFIYTLYVNIEIYYERSKGIALGTCGAAAINILLNIILLPGFGYEAAAYTTMFSYMLLSLFHYGICRFYLKKNVFASMTIFRYILLVLGYGTVVRVLIEYPFARLFIFFLTILPLLFFNKNRLSVLVKEMNMNI